MPGKFGILDPIDLYQSGALELDCASMELSQADAEAPTLYSGPGYIRQDGTGQIVFKVFPTETRNHPSPAEFAQGGTAGKLVSSDRYFSLAASDALGRRWVAEQIIPDTDAGVGGLISVSGSVHAITSKESAGYLAYGHEMRFFVDIDFVPTKYRIYRYLDGRAELLDASGGPEKLRTADFAFSIRKGDGVLTVGLDAVRPFPADIETRVVEALQFVLGRTLWCRAMRSHIGTAETIKLVSPRPASARTQLPPPIRTRTVAGHEHFWQLFDLYLRHVLRRSEPGWDPCSVHLYMAREASANSVEAYALGLAVAVEGITNALFPQCAKIEEDYAATVKEFFDYLKSLFNRMEMNMAGARRAALVKLDERIAGFRGQLLQVRAVDRMHQLAREGALDERHIVAWKKLRNTSAHAGTPGAPVDQQLFDNILSAAMMMYHMIFHAIGYEGRYIDYSTHGHPPRAYPSRELAPDKG